uniref:BAR domain-containing protein n=1 Tax=Meloidogyne javanica TaxID=6303 RepID=A0A915LFH8_MELJA
MDFNLKKLVNDAGGLFNRARQLTEEKLLNAERTEIDPQLEQLLQRVDATEFHMTKLYSALETYLQPNPAVRVGNAINEMLERRNSTEQRVNNLEYLGSSMLGAGQAFGSDTNFGNALLKMSTAEMKLGAAEREMMQTTSTQTLAPIKRFLEGDVRNILKERRVLQNKRLDLDSAKARLKRARSLESQASGADSGLIIEQVEADLRVAQSEYDRQLEVMRILIESANSAQNQHLKNLMEFVDAQAKFYENAHQHMADLKRELSTRSNGGPMI